MSLAEWPHRVSPGAADAPVLLMLHGTGGDETQMGGLAELLDPRAATLSPRGRVSEYGANRWFARLAEGVFDVDDVEARADELAGFLGEALTENALDGRPVIAVGFSNGANMALAVGMRHPELVSGVIAFSGMYPFGDREYDGSLTGLDVAVLGGHDDPMAPRTSVLKLVEQLHRRGATVRHAERPGGHGLTEADAAAARDWLAAKLPA